MREDVGGGKKKSQGKHRAAKAPYVKPGTKVGVPDNCGSQSKSGSKNPIVDNKILAADVAVSPGVPLHKSGKMKLFTYKMY
ncbi:hypothetical protein DSO57_1035549 [Entomophthora muscae]|uniref:Uncharacterized protein n=1 Tax=Entomophthora muscae TaxID=34485 RepID=A0ACC2SPA5_9FUNG|nr:hypothetical protein DSO57_1035549 [Entomophthora muscae]